jgi:hypothetical protein
MALATLSGTTEKNTLFTAIHSSSYLVTDLQLTNYGIFFIIPPNNLISDKNRHERGSEMRGKAFHGPKSACLGAILGLVCLLFLSYPSWAG